MKLTRHNGRSGKNGTYNPKHNDRRFAVSHSEHIDEERAKRNVYWDCYQGFHFPKDQEQEKKIVYSFEQVERTFYLERYDDYCKAQHERNRKTGHSHRDRTTEDLRLDKKTCPDEQCIGLSAKIVRDACSEMGIYFQDKKLVTRIFGSEDAPGISSCRFLRNKISHELMIRAIREVCERSIELLSDMDVFIKEIKEQT